MGRSRVRESQSSECQDHSSAFLGQQEEVDRQKEEGLEAARRKVEYPAEGGIVHGSKKTHLKKGQRTEKYLAQKNYEDIVGKLRPFLNEGPLGKDVARYLVLVKLVEEMFFVGMGRSFADNPLGAV